jgi:hypothetical protein
MSNPENHPPNLNNLREILDEYDRYATLIESGETKADLAKQIRGVVTEARLALRPSADSTANFVDSKRLVERLVSLKAEAEARS